jgi:antitoxin Phd
VVNDWLICHISQMAKLDDSASTVLFENRKGEEVRLGVFNATDVKNQFGKVLQVAERDGAALVTRHDQPSAVLLSFQEFEALTAARRAQAQALRPNFDELLARMQTPQAKSAGAELFAALPAELGAAALRAARKSNKKVRKPPR